MGNVVLTTLDKKSSKIFGIKNKELSNRGRVTEILDLIIASICISNNLILITRNKKHFENIPGLEFKVW